MQTTARGRKKAALTYVVTYTLGCFTKHWNNFTVLLVGRLFCGVATSLLYSAFESWLVAEHFKVRLANEPFCAPNSCQPGWECPRWAENGATVWMNVTICNTFLYLSNR